jgi:hypothetical protein
MVKSGGNIAIANLDAISHCKHENHNHDEENKFQYSENFWTLHILSTSYYVYMGMGAKLGTPKNRW